MISKWRVMSDANVDRFSFRNIGCMSWFRSSAQRSTEILIFLRRNEVNLRYLYQMLLRDVCDMSNALKNAAKSSNETDSNTKTDWKHSPINVPKRKKRREIRNILTQGGFRKHWSWWLVDDLSGFSRASDDCVTERTE